MKIFYESCVLHAVNHFKEFEVKLKTQMHPQANVCCLHSFVFSGFFFVYLVFGFGIKTFHWKNVNKPPETVPAFSSAEW